MWETRRRNRRWRPGKLSTARRLFDHRVGPSRVALDLLLAAARAHDRAGEAAPTPRAIAIASSQVIVTLAFPRRSQVHNESHIGRECRDTFSPGSPGCRLRCAKCHTLTTLPATSFGPQKVNSC